MDSEQWDGAALIGLDWGTTALRAYRFGAHGSVLESRASTCGIMRLAQPAATGGCDLAFETLCGDWLDVVDIPIIAAGMVGSAQGWIQAPYVPTPVSFAQLVGDLVRVRSARGSIVHIVPGIIEHSPLPNVMRGEETQIFGALRAYPHLGQSEKVLIGLPGTHAKWACTANGIVERFLTFMTGEVFSVLRDHTILGRTMHLCRHPHDEAFLRGVDAVITHGHVGVLSTIFSARTLGLTNQLTPEEQSDYLSGLLIGHELTGLIQAVISGWESLSDWTVGLIGEAVLCRRYQTALARLGGIKATILSGATEQGLFRIARQAGLVSGEVRTH
jgi:2-dehydro-3-deoxygalactonokinase